MKRLLETVPLISIVLFMSAGNGFANTPPFVSTPIPDTSMRRGGTLSIDLKQHFKEITNGHLGYFIDVSPTRITGKADISQKLVLRADSLWIGNAKVIVTAINTEQETAHDTFFVEVVPGPFIQSKNAPNRFAILGPTIQRTAVGGLLVRFARKTSGDLRIVNAAGQCRAKIRIRDSATLRVSSPLGPGVYYVIIRALGEEYNCAFLSLR